MNIIVAHLDHNAFCSTGLFTADQQLKGNSPIYTRQNNAGNRRGYEVPEERDYYPYWGPSPWKDIAIMVSDGKTFDLMKRHVNSSQYGYKCECILVKILLEISREDSLGVGTTVDESLSTPVKNTSKRVVRYLTAKVAKTSLIISLDLGWVHFQLQHMR